MSHDEVFASEVLGPIVNIQGTRDDLKALRDAIDRAIETGRAEVPNILTVALVCVVAE